MTSTLNLESAKAAGLKYLSDELPGITRRLRGGHFQFFDAAGKRIIEKGEIDRIRALAIPPAYTNVWISPIANGHLQATGRDARGRKQYRYHKRWREVRDETKFDHIVAFGKALPAIRAKVEEHLNLPGLPREKVLATVVQLLETTLIRVGNEEYAKENASYGLSTLESRHVRVDGSTLRFRFRGKSGVRHAIDLQDRRLARIVRACRDIPGQELFQYVDDDEACHNIDSQDVNEYIREIAGADFSAKDFRTWVGTVTCAVMLSDCPPFDSPADAKKNIVEAIKQVAGRLGNTAAVCRNSYVHPAILEDYLAGGTMPRVRKARGRRLKSTSHLRAEEKATLRMLERRAAQSDPQRTSRLLRASLRQKPA